MPSSPLGNTLGFPLGGPSPGAIPAEIRHDAFGKDIAFRSDLVVTSRGDYATVEGYDNLRAAIIRRCITRTGEYRLRPSYGVGLPSFVKKPMTQAMLVQLKHRIIENLSEEPRIERISDVTLTPTFIGGQSALRVTVAVVSIGREVRFPPFDVTGG